MTTKKPKKRNPSDLTTRNAKAYNKRFERIEQWLIALTEDVAQLYDVMLGEKPRARRRK